MQNASNPLFTMYNTQLEASRRFADAVFAGTEKIDLVMRGATQRAFNEQMNLVQAITAARDPRSIGTTLQSSLLTRNPDDAVSYHKEIVRIMAEMQNEISRSMQDCMEQIRTSATTDSTRPSQAAQAHTSDALFNPMTSMFSVWESAFKEVAELAKKNMVVARGAMEQAADTTARQVVGNMNSAVDTAQGTANNAVDQASRSAATMAAETEIVTSSIDDKRATQPSTSGRKK